MLLMDEPFAALDAITRDLLHEELTRVWQEQGIAVVFVTHNVREAVRLGQRVVLMGSRPGRVVREWQVEVDQPRQIESPGVAALAAEITAAAATRRSAAMAVDTHTGRASGDRRRRRRAGRPRVPRWCRGSGGGRRGPSAGRVLPPLVAVAVLVGIWQLAYLADLKPSLRPPEPGRRPSAPSWS